MGIEIGIAFLEKVFFYTSFLEQYWIQQLVIIGATLAFITRKAGDWKTLALPVMAGWQIFGMRTPWVFYAVAVMLFVIDVLSMKAMEGALGAVRDSLGVFTSTGRERRRLQRIKGRVNVKEELKKLRETAEIEEANKIKSGFTKEVKDAIKRKDELRKEKDRRKEIMQRLEDRAYEKAVKKKYFKGLWEEDMRKSKPKEEYTE